MVTRRAGLYAAILALLVVALVAVMLLRGPGTVNLAVSEQVATEAVPPASETALSELENRFVAIGAAFDGQIGIAFEDIETGATADHNGAQIMPQQSVSKLWVALAALELTDEGVFDLEDRTTIRREDLTLFHQPLRKRILAGGPFTTTNRDLLERALIGSDNTANDALLRAIGGPEIVRSILKRRGLDGIRFGPGEREMQSAIAGLEWRPEYSLGKRFFEVRKQVAPDVRRQAFDGYVADPVDGASSVQLASALASLARGELLSEDRTGLLIDILARVKSGPNRLKGGVPEGWSIAHKTGTGQVLDLYPPGVIGDQAGYNDIGILTAPDGRRYAVVVMIARTRTPVPERMAMMHEVVGAVADYHYAATGQEKPADAEPAKEGPPP